MKKGSKNKRGKNLARLKKDLEKGRQKTKAYPAVLYLEATAICNLRCPMCPTTMGIPREPYRKNIFDLDLLPKIKPVLPYISRCFMSGGGEPLLHPDLFRIIATVKDHGAPVYFNCNATLLSEERARLMVEKGVDTISFSVDGATDETYSKVRVGAELGTTMENIKRLAGIKKQAGAKRPFLNMQFTLLDLNRHEVEEMVPLATSLGINQLVVEPLTPVFSFDRAYRDYYNQHAVAPDAALMESLEAASRKAREQGLIFSSHYLYARDNPEPPRKCVQPWLTFGVRVDGRVFTCCGTMEQMGDLSVEDWHRIWNGEKYRSLRRAVAGGAFPEFCSLCIKENRANHFNEELLGG